MISILLPAYKSKYLREAIESVLTQTYKDWELIIVNDKSPQPIDKVVSKYHDSRIRYFVNEVNIGGSNPVANWNRCLSYAKGEYLTLLCDDDLFKPNFLEEMMKLAEKYPQCSVFRSGVEIIDADNKAFDFYPSSPEWESCEDYMWHVFRGYRCQTVTEWFYRTKKIRELGGYVSLPLAWYSDFLSTFKFSIQGGIASTSKHLVSFRMSGENITSQKERHTLQKMEASCLFEEAIKVIIKENDFQKADVLSPLLSKYLRGKRTYSLCTCRWNDLFQILKDWRHYHIDFKMIFKSLIYRLLIWQ